MKGTCMRHPSTHLNHCASVAQRQSAAPTRRRSGVRDRPTRTTSSERRKGRHFTEVSKFESVTQVPQLVEQRSDAKVNGSSPFLGATFFVDFSGKNRNQE